MGDFVLVEVMLEQRKNVGTLAGYVAQVLDIMEDGRFNLSFLRARSGQPNTFSFPDIRDELPVEPGQVKGVLVTRQEGTKRQASVIRVFPPLTAFNMH